MNFSLDAALPEFFKSPPVRIAQKASWVLWFMALVCVLPAAAVEPTLQAGAQDEVGIGRRIYNEGRLPSGQPLKGIRYATTTVSGATAACVNCHRRSGMGQVEGDIMVPPITGNYLYGSRSDKHLATMDPRVSKFFNQSHDPYTDSALANAILKGINIQGREMDALMPRFELNAAELRALTAYLKQLSFQWSPGVSVGNIRFATVITPDVDPVRRKVMVDMMQTIFRQKNGSTHTATQGGTRHHMTSAAEMVLGTERNWDLDIWELQGLPETWGAQLAERYRNQPVFALVSGVTDSTWQPVQDFCEREQVPCWFPSVEAPVKKQTRYTFYFSGGVSLEADVLARSLLDQKHPPKRVVQIYRDDEVGRAAAQTLTRALAGSAIEVESRILQSDLVVTESLTHALEKIKKDDNVMFWLRPADITALGSLKPTAGKRYFSGVLGKGEQAPLAENWRANSYLIYPYELPENRATNLASFHAWLNIRKIPLVDETMQSEIFFAMNFMTDTLSEMLENLYRDYLIERAETMITKREGSKVEQENRDRSALGRPGDMQKKHGSLTMDESVRIPLFGHNSSDGKNMGTTMYPHLSLGPEQRFASKGAYIVQFAQGNGSKLTSVSEWIVP